MFNFVSEKDVKTVGLIEPDTIIHADCLNVFEYIPDGSVDMIMCDPPYEITACDWDMMIPLKPMWQQLKRVTKKNGAIVLMGSQPFTSVLIMSNINDYKATWYWQKERGTNFVQAKRYPMRVIEDCLVFCEKTPFYKPIMRIVKSYSHVLPRPRNGSAQHMDSKSLNSDKSRIYKNYDKAYPINVLKFPRDNMKKGISFHPTQKPIKLMEYMIKTYTNEGETVLDFAMGSGTTGIACQNLKRKFIGIEKELEYFEIGKKRIKDNARNLF